ncbi:MAG: DUF3810 domain-containing protein [Nonlabens sp.]
MRRLLVFVALLVLQLVGYAQLRNFPEIVEQFYSTGIYPYIGKTYRWLFGWIPFSVGDIAYIIAIGLSLRWLWISRWGIITLSRKRFSQLFLTLNIVIFLFNLSWGFNYYRQPLHQVLELGSDYTTEELIATIEYYTDSSNRLHEQLQQVDSLPVRFTRTQDQLFELAPDAFKKLEAIYPELDYGESSIKKSLLTYPLSYMGYGGYLNPFTGEAQVNANIEFYKAPVLILHEMSHQLGFAKENEANFIAIITGKAHSDLYFNYSASIFALRYCLNDLYRRDPAQYKLATIKLRPGIMANYKELQEFWQAYEGVIEDVSQVTYNTYLKANNQPGGIKTYSYVVALLVNHQRINGYEALR